MKIKDLPEQNRPRERFLKHGPKSIDIFIANHIIIGSDNYWSWREND